MDLFAAEHFEGIVRGAILDAHRAAEGGVSMSEIIARIGIVLILAALVLLCIGAPMAIIGTMLTLR